VYSENSRYGEPSTLGVDRAETGLVIARLSSW
jgi:hypothetical protein